MSHETTSYTGNLPQTADDMAVVSGASSSTGLPSGRFVPQTPRAFRDAGLHEGQVEALILKFMVAQGVASGREIARQLMLPFGIIDKLLQRMKYDHLIGIKADSPPGDFVYELSEIGAERGRRYLQQSPYFGVAPVPFQQYVESVEAQSLRHERVDANSVLAAFSDLVLSEEMLMKLGESMNLGLGLFLHGKPGNGKTAIATRLVQGHAAPIWIPRYVIESGEIIRLFDPLHHMEMPIESDDQPDFDRRWVRIHRPAVMLGGELRLNDFDLKANPVAGISEAPVQMKSNGGIMIIDEFGRHTFRPDELLNRLIVPLESRIDILRLPSGRIIQVPFDPMAVFSTNLNPMEITDEAFLRRIPYAIDVIDPTEDEFRQVFLNEAAALGIEVSPKILDYLTETHYRRANREMRFCHPRDILRRVRNACDYLGSIPLASKERIDSAVASSLGLQTAVTSQAAS